ncbi:DNA-binding MarR family transcriptional regulator [Glaciihabitans tibetensis]|uniref:DNA-binding MarR family transcriptional regulator n=1 Tax=Glaciihabitans tibetensis TaxID=1266600 RepID=A0A2T0VI90_9MICO|nr:MarR family transcriptional regulator [Glaciihabitans tibetensis]PRY69950.1 DNA-binding MarR family transcriptional regulator [Glaciihabitans tibetensis]
MQPFTVDDAEPTSAVLAVSGPPQIEVREASKLLREVLQLTSAFESKVSSALSVNRRDFDAMQHLIASGPLSPSQIARRLGVTTAAATIIVDRLTAVGHVTREPHPTDRRGVMVVPTPASVDAAMGHVLPLIMGVDRLLDDFTTTERAAITTYLRRVAHVYQEQLR